MLPNAFTPLPTSQRPRAGDLLCALSIDFAYCSGLNSGPMPPFFGRRVASIVAASLLALSPTARAEPPPLKIAVITTLGGADERREGFDGFRRATDDG